MPAALWMMQARFQGAQAQQIRYQQARPEHLRFEPHCCIVDFGKRLLEDYQLFRNPGNSLASLPNMVESSPWP